jgi:hypothetical protein
MSTSDASAELAVSRGAGGPAVTFATTEHFNLQTARALTVSEANGRASIYLAALSGNLIALAFVGQMSRLGAAFYAFALIMLPVLAFVGVVTFVRLVQSSIEDIAYANRIALLRSFYLRVSPELEPYLIAVSGPSSAAPRRSGRRRGRSAGPPCIQTHPRLSGPCQSAPRSRSRRGGGSRPGQRQSSRFLSVLIVFLPASPGSRFGAARSRPSREARVLSLRCVWTLEYVLDLGARG